MNAPAPEQVTVIYAAGRSPAPGRRRASGPAGVAAALGHLAIAAAIFYAVWWPLDFWVTSILLWKVPIMTAWQVDQAMSTIVSGPLEEGLTSASRSLYPSHERGPILIVAAYGWEAVMALAVWLWAAASGALLGSRCAATTRRFFGRAALIVLLGLAAWAAGMWLSYGTGFPIWTGQVGVGGVGLLLLLAGVAAGRGGTLLTVAASLWLMATSAVSVMALTLADRCDALEPRYATTGFKTLVFAIQSAYAWLILTALTGRALSRRSIAR